MTPPCPAVIEADLTSFLAARRTVTIERRFLDDGQNSFWAITLSWLFQVSRKPTSAVLQLHGKF